MLPTSSLLSLPHSSSSFFPDQTCLFNSRLQSCCPLFTHPLSRWSPHTQLSCPSCPGPVASCGPRTAPPPSPALLNLDCALSFPLIFSTSHDFSLSSLISPLSPLIIPVAQMWFSIHASKMAGSRLDTFPVYILGSLAIFLTRSQNVTDPPSSTHLYTSITWSRAWDVIST